MLFTMETMEPTVFLIKLELQKEPDKLRQREDQAKAEREMDRDR